MHPLCPQPAFSRGARCRICRCDRSYIMRRAGRPVAGIRLTRPIRCFDLGAAFYLGRPRESFPGESFRGSFRMDSARASSPLLKGVVRPARRLVLPLSVASLGRARRCSLASNVRRFPVLAEATEGAHYSLSRKRDFASPLTSIRWSDGRSRAVHVERFLFIFFLS